MSIDLSKNYMHMTKSKLKQITKWIMVSILGLIVILFGFGYWFLSLLPHPDHSIKNMKVSDLPYLREDSIQNRGKILAVVTSTDRIGNTDRKTGYELTELARAYYVFQANGFEVDIASPAGGDPPVIIDDEDMGVYDYAFMNDPVAQSKTQNTIHLDSVNGKDYQAVYFVGGKGAMFDFPENSSIQLIVRDYQKTNKVIGAVCHGPAAFINVNLLDGTTFLEGKRISGFTNDEELLLIPDAGSIFPFLLEDMLVEKGAIFNGGAMYLENVVRDGNLVTGQNPWSTWSVAETMIHQLGYIPKERSKTPEETASEILLEFENGSYQDAKSLIEYYSNESNGIDRVLIAKHSIVSAIRGRILKSVGLIRLVVYTKSVSEG